MIHSTRGIVFRTIKFSESSVISKIYTEKFGMQSYIVNGVRSQKSKTKACLLQVMGMLDLQVYYHEHRNLHRIKEMRPSYVFSSILFDPLRSSIGLFMMDVLNKCIHEEESNEAMFAFIMDKLQLLDQQKKILPDHLLKFLLDLASLLGFFPHGEFTDASPYFDLQDGKFVTDVSVHASMIHPPLSGIFSSVIKNEGEALPAAIRKNLLMVLLDYYKFHVPNFSMPKSLHVLQEVFQG